MTATWVWGAGGLNPQSKSAAVGGFFARERYDCCRETVAIQEVGSGVARALPGDVGTMDPQLHGRRFFFLHDI